MHISSRSGTFTQTDPLCQHFLSKSIDQNLSPPIYQFPYETPSSPSCLPQFDRNLHHRYPISLSIIHGSKRFPPPRFSNYPTSHAFSNASPSNFSRVEDECASRLLEGRSRSTSSLRLSTVFRGLCLRDTIPPLTQITSCLEADALSRGAKVKQVRRRYAA